MSQPDRIPNPVQVEVKNWPDPPAKLPAVKNSSIRTVVLAGNLDGLNTQISDYEPRRVRMAIWVIDAAVAISDSQPNTTPDASTSTTKTASGGAVLPVSVIPYEFFGPDAWWLNQLGTITRVTILKEFC
jgi:hypothetical protein